VAKETRKLKRAQQAAAGAKPKKQDLTKVAPPRADLSQIGPGSLKPMLGRLAIPVVGAWVVFGLIATVVTSKTAQLVLIAIPAIVTVLALGVVYWATRQAKKARGVANILGSVETAEDRKAAIDQLDASFKKNDPAKIFAKAQLEMQEDPQKALRTLETINLGKVLAPVADEARGQRAMIHLMLGEVAAGRQLVDGIDLSRHQEPRSRAMLAAVCAEAWARSGASSKALETLALFDPEESTLEQVKPQLYRASAFAYANANDQKNVRKALKKLADIDLRLLGGFMAKRAHPLLQKEAKKMLEQSGAVPRKMQVQRRP
jgi:hypothetical protein